MPSLVVLGARNLGGAILGHHLNAGWRGAAVAHSPETLEAVRAAGGLPLQADASDPDSLRDALERARAEFGSIDLIVNAVSAARPTKPGPFGGGTLAEASVEDFRGWTGAVAEQAFVFLSEGVRAGASTLIQVTGGSARRAMAGRGLAIRVLASAMFLHLVQFGIPQAGNRCRAASPGRSAAESSMSCSGGAAPAPPIAASSRKNSLEARRRDDLEDPRGLVAGVPERVPLVARLEDEVAGLGDHHLVAEQRAHAAPRARAVLVLARVAVERRGERARRHRVLDHREPTAGLIPVGHVPCADAAEEAQVSVARSHDLRCRRLHRRHPFQSDSMSRETVRQSCGCVKIHRTDMSDEKRPYRKKRRAELEEETRLRITESAVALHGSLGPAHTSMSAVAEHAGRAPLDPLPPLPRRGGALRGVLGPLACRKPARRTSPSGPTSRIPTPACAPRSTAMYSYYRRAEAMIANLLRDIEVPARRLADGRVPRVPRRRFATRSCAAGPRRRAVRAAIGHALAFTTWRSLARQQELDDRQAVELMCRLVAAA